MPIRIIVTHADPTKGKKLSYNIDTFVNLLKSLPQAVRIVIDLSRMTIHCTL